MVIACKICPVEGGVLKRPRSRDIQGSAAGTLGRSTCATSASDKSGRSRMRPRSASCHGKSGFCAGQSNRRVIQRPLRQKLADPHGGVKCGFLLDGDTVADGNACHSNKRKNGETRHWNVENKCTLGGGPDPALGPSRVPLI